MAGYRNTVGSEAGWTPINAVSTKDKPFIHKKQTILDFMDDEDLVAFNESGSKRGWCQPSNEHRL